MPRRRTTLLIGVVCLAGVLALLTHRPGGELPSTEAVVQRAMTQLIAQCMRANGFQYPVAAATPPILGSPPDLTLGADDSRWAQLHGFGIAETDAAQERVRAIESGLPLERYVHSLSAAQAARFQAALHGDLSASRITAPVPTGGELFTGTQGCWAQAENRLYPNRLTWFRAQAVSDALPALAVRQTLSDERFVSARKRWAACIAGAGLPAVTGPEELVADVLRDASLRRRERVVASVSATCSAATGMTAVGRVVRDRHLAELRQHYRVDLEHLSQQSSAAMQRAARYVQSTERN